MLNFNVLYAGLDPAVQILLSLSIMLLAGFLITRLTKLAQLPRVTGYIVAGVLIGPYVLGLVPQEIIHGMSFVSDIALAFIAFSVGQYFKKEIIQQTGAATILVTVLESVLAGVLVVAVLRLAFHMDWNFALLLGAVATATAPASTMMTINQYRAKGTFVNVLLQVVALDDVVCLLVFSIVTAIVNANASGTVNAVHILLPLLYNVLMVAAGLACGWLLSKLLTPARSRDNRLILVMLMLLAICGICGILNISPLLSCMALSTAYINLTHDDRLFKQIGQFTPPVMSLFFVLSGMSLNMTGLASVGVIGVVYFLVRIIGKYLGAYVGATVTGMPKSTRNYLGLALIPQAGVSIGLAFMAQRMLPGELGNLFLTVILSSSVLYELIGPACGKLALVLAGSIPKEALHDGVTSGSLPTQEQMETVFVAEDPGEAQEPADPLVSEKEPEARTVAPSLPNPRVAQPVSAQSAAQHGGH